MNKWDRNNLDYLMSLSEEEFDEFMASVPDEDIEYAIELIQTRRAENLVELEELRDIVFKEDGMDLSQAQTVLARFQL